VKGVGCLCRAGPGVRPQRLTNQSLPPIAYAVGPWESVDWSLFDLVGIDHYHEAANRATYREQLRAYFAHGCPVVVTEFGCCTYCGAQDRSALGWAIVDRAARPPQLTETVVRDEQEQADYVTEMGTSSDLLISTVVRTDRVHRIGI
jgi:hypothetical protein